MDELRLGDCLTWKPVGGGLAASVTLMALDLERDKAQVHVQRASTGTCASHWVDMAQLSAGRPDGKPCGCAPKPAAGGEDDHHAA